MNYGIIFFADAIGPLLELQIATKFVNTSADAMAYSKYIWLRLE